MNNLVNFYNNNKSQNRTYEIKSNKQSIQRAKIKKGKQTNLTFSFSVSKHKGNHKNSKIYDFKSILFVLNHTLH